MNQITATIFGNRIPSRHVVSRLLACPQRVENEIFPKYRVLAQPSHENGRTLEVSQFPFPRKHMVVGTHTVSSNDRRENLLRKNVRGPTRNVKKKGRVNTSVLGDIRRKHVTSHGDPFRGVPETPAERWLKKQYAEIRAIMAKYEVLSATCVSNKFSILFYTDEDKIAIRRQSGDDESSIVARAWRWW